MNWYLSALGHVSGTAVIDDFGPRQMETGELIIYTSADPVLQIAAHEDIIPLDELYRICEYARSITLERPALLGRIIARPYVGTPGNFTRTANRHDYAVPPSGRTVLDALKDAGFDVISIGKISDIFAGVGITLGERSQSSVHGMEQTIAWQEKDFTGLVFTNLVDFDALWGHRRNPVGYGEELERFDEKLGIFLSRMQEGDLLMVTADHGNDPTFKGTDHTREVVPLLVYTPGITPARLEDRSSFADIGATIAENFGVAMPENCIGEALGDL